MQIELWAHKRCFIACLYRKAMKCILLIYWRKIPCCKEIWMYPTWIVSNPTFTFHLFDTHRFTNSGHVIAFSIMILIDLGKESIDKQHLDIARINGDLLSMRLSQQFIKWHSIEYHKVVILEFIEKAKIKKTRRNKGTQKNNIKYGVTLQVATSRGLFHYKKSLQVWDFWYEDDMVMRPSYLNDGNSYAGIMTSTYWNCLQESGFKFSIRIGFEVYKKWHVHHSNNCKIT